VSGRVCVACFRSGGFTRPYAARGVFSGKMKPGIGRRTLSFLRTEAKAENFGRWREVLGGITVAPGRLCLVNGAGAAAGDNAGYALILAGVVFVWIGGQRVRFRKLGLGAGGQYRWTGAIDRLFRTVGQAGSSPARDGSAEGLERGAYPAPLETGNNPDIKSRDDPVDAAGAADALFWDAFAALPGPAHRTQCLAELARRQRPVGGDLGNVARCARFRRLRH